MPALSLKCNLLVSRLDTKIPGSYKTNTDGLRMRRFHDARLADDPAPL